ncbi:PGDYG domain-containing protein [Paraburkholderia sp. MMS20-SJTR3]|uniref:PGDYG domain-containing protein n=1 Tax=Paraburkholderia sejongensis TaxID=2886946 RepID=A0ABS8K115_9BURK|nr:PGDYG domain-containing protein [Paraburkholderia sp. MMS20-SJTR3]MCC8395831.1 PGDYG domain-containing protein [Paraburkholderia sp. MMS20-SJTR3]
MNRVSIAARAGAFRTCKRPLRVQVSFAGAAGQLETLEGTVQYARGDALLTGVEGELWPVPRERFFATYAPLAPTRHGENGSYVKVSEQVWAWRADAPTDLALAGARGTLHVASGDFIVESDSGEVWVVAASIFAKTYEAEA